MLGPFIIKQIQKKCIQNLHFYRSLSPSLGESKKKTTLR